MAQSNGHDGQDKHELLVITFPLVYDILQNYHPTIHFCYE